MKKRDKTWWLWLAATLALLVFAVTAGLQAFFASGVSLAKGCRFTPGPDAFLKTLLVISAIALVWLGVFGIIRFVSLPLRQVTRNPHPDFTEPKALEDGTLVTDTSDSATEASPPPIHLNLTRLQLPRLTLPIRPRRRNPSSRRPRKPIPRVRQHPQKTQL